MKQQGGQGAHQNDQRQGLERQHEAQAGIRGIERRRPSPQIAEHEGGAGLGRALKHRNQIVQHLQRLPNRLNPGQKKGKTDLETQSRNEKPPGEPATLGGIGSRGQDQTEDPGQPDETQKTKGTLKQVHMADPSRGESTSKRHFRTR